jgi:hypothetical protein
VYKNKRTTTEENMQTDYLHTTNATLSSADSNQSQCYISNDSLIIDTDDGVKVSDSTLAQSV